ncbi:MAG: sugar phosphate isomerase/epimerase family protein [Bacillota bacterium]
MKLAFTTLGCPDWDLETIINNAAKYGYDGVDFRGYQGEMDIYRLSEFSSNSQDTYARFKDAGLEVPCFSSSVRFYSEDKKQVNNFCEEIKHYTELCHIFKADYIRIFGGKIKEERSRKDAIEMARENLFKLVQPLENTEIKLLVETHDDWVDSNYLLEVIKEFNRENVGVLWDIHHPYRYADESPATTWSIFGDRIEYTHWKDSYLLDKSTSDNQLCLMGEGDLPLKEFYQVLKDNNYNGYLTLEWEKKWHPEIAEPEVAFPQYVDYMKKLD